jgi:hypothetical protein
VLFKENERNDIHKKYERKESGEKEEMKHFPKTKAVRLSEDSTKEKRGKEKERKFD